MLWISNWIRRASESNLSLELRQTSVISSDPVPTLVPSSSPHTLSKSSAEGSCNSRASATLSPSQCSKVRAQAVRTISGARWLPRPRFLRRATHSAGGACEIELRICPCRAPWALSPPSLSLGIRLILHRQWSRIPRFPGASGVQI